MERAVITGIGCVTPIGVGVNELSRALRAGLSGTRRVSLVSPDDYRCAVAAEVQGFDPRLYMSLKDARSSPRVVQFGLAAARLALEDARLPAWQDPTRVGAIVGTSVGPSAYNFDQFAVFMERGIRRVPPAFPAQAHYGVLASECAIQLGIRGPVMSLSSACTSGADAIGLGRVLIETGMADVVVAGGAEAPICPLLFAAFDRLSLMPTKFNDRPEVASRPFSADRDGFVLGEGAAILVIESASHAMARGAQPVAELCGYAATCDAYDHFCQDETGSDARRAISQALAAAKIAPSEVQYVNAHGSATRRNDSFETRVLKDVFGSAAANLQVSSSKSMMGHLLGASGAVELAATLIGMRNEFLPPTINLDFDDPSCDLDYVANTSREQAVDVAVSLSFGFGSRNAALVVRRWAK